MTLKNKAQKRSRPRPAWPVSKKVTLMTGDTETPTRGAYIPTGAGRYRRWALRYYLLIRYIKCHQCHQCHQPFTLLGYKGVTEIIFSVIECHPRNLLTLCILCPKLILL